MKTEKKAGAAATAPTKLSDNAGALSEKDTTTNKTKSLSTRSQSIIRVEKNRDYKAINTLFLKDSTLSLKAKGLLTYCLSKPDNWQFYLIAMARELKENKDTIAKILLELINTGYVQRQRRHDKQGKFKGYDYTIYEIKQPYPKSSDTVKPETVSSDLLSKEFTNKGRKEREYYES